MAELTLNLLGKPQVTLAGRPLTHFSTAKTAALLYYLAATSSKDLLHSRETLAGLLWGETSETQARKSLTKALSTLNKLLAPYLCIDRQGAAFNQAADCQVDVTTFEALMATGDPPQTVEPLRAAVALYQGDFLEGFSVKDAPAFEEWVLTQREHLRALVLHALDALVDDALHRADYITGLEDATRLLVLDPWRESAHRQMMILLARSGQRPAALAQYERCRQALADELGVGPLPETIALYEQLKATAEPPPHNLPPPRLFVGREVELGQLVSRLNDPDCRLLTLVGPGGVGKTRLAIEGARHYVQPERTLGEVGFTDGVYTVNMATLIGEDLATPARVEHSSPCQKFAMAIADALRLSLLDLSDLIEPLLNHLRHKTMLLALDNYEPLHEEDPFVTSILQNAPGVKLLVTSRERLNLREEWTMAIGGLDYPASDWGPGGAPATGDGNEDEIAILENYSAVAFFVRQAQRVRGEFLLPRAEAPSIVRICQLVEGFPLALELAADWLRVLSCAEIVQEIEKNLDFLSTTMSNMSERHRSMRAVFARSWQRLSPQEQAVFRQLSVFRGGFQREAAQAVAAASLRILTSLVDKSLLRLTPTGHYEIHELLRQFAAEPLRQSSDEEARL